MSIRTKSLLVFGITGVILLIVVYFISSYILLSNISTIEDRNISNNVDRARYAIENNIEELSTKSSDWAAWDDSYQYIEDRNKVYEESNLQNSSLSNLRINFMIFITNSGEIVKAMGIDIKTAEEIEIPELLLQYSSTGSALLAHENTKSVKSGVMTIEEKVLMFASRPIITSSGDGTIRGTLLFARFLDEDVLSHLSELTRIEIQMKPTYIYGQIAKKATAKKISARTIIDVEDEQRISGYYLFNDFFGKEAFVILVPQSRDIYQKTKQSINLYVAELVGIGITFGLLTYFLLNLIILKRMSQLNEFVTYVEEKQDLSKKIKLTGNDELSHLADQFNKMIEKLQISYHNLLDKINEEKRINERIELEVKNRTEELQEEHARLSASISSLRLGFVITDINNNIVIINGAAKRIIFQPTVETDEISFHRELLTKKITFEEICVQLYDTLDLRTHIHSCINQKHPIDIPEIRLRDRYYHLFVSPVVLLKQGIEVIGCVILFEDITDRKILERSRDEFFSIASHELRTPLTSIRGNTALIKEYYSDKLNDPSLKEMVEDIHESSVRLIEIVNDFLNVSRLEQGRITFKIEEIDLTKLAEEVIYETQNLAKQKNLYLKLENNINSVPLILTDRDRTKEVLYNLIGNAIKFTEKGGVTISMNVEGNFLITKIADTGRGISQESQSLLFKKFQQANNNIFTRDTTKGTGLGLYISKLIIEGVGGKILLEHSTPEQGTTFSFSLPLAKKV